MKPDSDSQVDDSVPTAARAALRGSGHIALTGLDCHLVEGAIVLSGSVPTYYLKQLAQSVVLRMRPDLRLKNCVVVRRP
jgi:hypothetical protein